MLLFVYGTLKKNEINHIILKRFNAKFIDNAITIKKYALASLLSCPALLEKSLYNVKGELYQVNTKTLKYLDKFEIGYKRKKIKVKTKTKIYNAYAYFYMKKDYIYILNTNEWRGKNYENLNSY